LVVASPHAEQARAGQVRAGLSDEQEDAFLQALAHTTADAVDMVIGIAEDIEDKISGGHLPAGMSGPEKRFQAYTSIQERLGYKLGPGKRTPIPLKFTDVVEVLYGASTTGFKHGRR
jgi:hypothetical protein